MNIEKLFWSETKTDILKYLVFVREGISIRGLENKLNWSFPAIKNQIEILYEWWIINIEKDNNWRKIFLKDNIKKILKELFIESIKNSILDICKENIKYIIRWDFFWNKINTDLVLIYKDNIEEIKNEISNLLHKYFINSFILTPIKEEDFLRRLKAGDKFALLISMHINIEK